MSPEPDAPLLEENLMVTRPSPLVSKILEFVAIHCDPHANSWPDALAKSLTELFGRPPIDEDPRQAFELLHLRLRALEDERPTKHRVETFVDSR